MSGRERRNQPFPRACGLVGILAALAAAGCAEHTAPHGFLPTPVQAQSDAFGSWIELSLRDDRTAAGELLAVGRDSLWVFQSDGVRAIATADVWRGRLETYNAQEGTLAIMTVLGTAATASHGLYLILTAPMWIIGGTIATARQSHEPIHKLPASSWTELAPFARFPQGLPPGLDLQHLLPRPVTAAQDSAG